MSYDWKWRVFLEDTGSGQTYGQWLLSAWGWTLTVAGLSWIVALLLGVLIGVLRTLPGRRLRLPRLIGTVWVELFRNIPLLVQVFLWYFVVPALVPALKGAPALALVVAGLGCFTSARVAEQVRAGLTSLPTGQMQAALALGLNLPQAYRFVLLPAALRMVLPPLISEAMGIIKNSSVAFAVSIADLTLFAMQAQEETSRGFEIYLAVTALYVLSALVVGLLLGAVEARLQRPPDPSTLKPGPR